MIKRIFFLIPWLVLVIGCSDLEFVYGDFNKLTVMKKIDEKILLSISGDNKDIIYSYFLSKIKEAKSEPVYILSIFSRSSIEAAVIETDATASKFMIKHDIEYALNNMEKNCIIFQENISTQNFYKAKSAGYSFGTDFAEKELSTRNLRSNIDQFLTKLSINYNGLKCKK